MSSSGASPTNLDRMEEHTEETALELAHFLLAEERANARIAAIRRSNNALRVTIASEMKDFEVSLARLRKQAEPVVKISPRISDSLFSDSSITRPHDAQLSHQKQVNP